MRGDVRFYLGQGVVVRGTRLDSKIYFVGADFAVCRRRISLSTRR